MGMSQDALEPIEPERAIELYLEDRSDELRTATQRAHRSALGIFEEWAAEYGLTNLNDLSGRDLIAFKNWRKKETDISTVTLNGALGILKRFFRFCEIIEAVEPDFHERVPLPNVPPDAEVKDDAPEDEAVEAIRSYYQQFEYASRRHTQFELIAEIGVRLGTAIAIDLDDIQWDREAIQIRHRPMESEGETPLKNGAGGERIVNLSPSFTGLLEDYVQHNRHDVEDDVGREPLFTTSKGRASTTTIRRDFYKLTRPCEYSNDCPHDRDISDCEATAPVQATTCPSSFTTHPLRKWSIMQQLNDGVPKEILSDRVDVSVPILDKHYDQRSEERKSQRRREVLESNHRQYHMTDGGSREE
ncbi:integrase family protein [Salinarchaeum sp. Harcht-Bsk1]|nr:integrase family protein [Salinarchaeum sp. Harcht-Bsk1]